MENYRISKNVRKWSSTPIVRPYIDDKGKEKEEMVVICTGKKKEADELALKIVKLLNQKETPEEAYARGRKDGFRAGVSSDNLPI
jgi:hypothetical protein